MLNFEELSDEQLRELAGGLSEDFSKADALSRAIEKFEYIEKKYGGLIKDFEHIKLLLTDKEFDEAYESCSKLGISLDRLSTRVKMYPFEIGEKSSNKKIKLKGAAKGKILTFDRTNDYLRILMPEILPRKQQFDVESGKMNYYYDIDSFKATYHKQFYEEFINGKYRIFSEKVSICYIMHISKDMALSMGDTDNYDTKVMTDIISTYLLHDDDFLCCNYFVDIVIDKSVNSSDKAFTEIIVCPADRREEILKTVL